MFVILVLICINYIPIVVSLNCIASTVKFEFHKISANQKSSTAIMAVNNFTTVEKCAEFTKHKGGLAFNYAGHRVAFGHSMNSSSAPLSSNCEVLYCPEVRNMSNMVNNTRYEYYSLYLIPSKSMDLICEPGIGVFKLHDERKNYTNALKSCEESGGRLADILSVDRTNTLSKILSKIRFAWIGLREVERKGYYVTSRAKSLTCYRYRAWYPGHPKQRTRLNCVVLTNSYSWRTMDCSTKHPYICELLISGIVNNFLN